MQSKLTNQNRLWFAFFSFLLAWSFCAYSFVFNMMADGQLFARMVNNRPTVLDYLLFYEDAQLAMHAKDQNINIYDPKIQFEGLKKLMAPVVPEAEFYSHYPPPLFVFVIPFGLFSLNWSYIVWNVLGISLTLCAILPIIRKEHKKPFPVILTTAVVLGSFPTWLCFELGQSSFFLTAGFALFVWLVRKEKYFLAGVSILCLMIKVQYLPFAVVIGLVLGRFKFVAGSIVGLLLTLGICVLTLGWENCAQYPNVLLHGETGTSNLFLIAPQQMQNIRGMLNLFVGDTSTVRMVSAGLCIMALCVVGYIWTKPYRALKKVNAHAFDIVLAITLMLALIFSVHAHTQDYCLFIWACVLCYVSLPDTKSGDVALLRRLILAFPMLSWLMFGLKPVTMDILHIQTFALYLIVILVLAVKTLLIPVPEVTTQNS